MARQERYVSAAHGDKSENVEITLPLFRSTNF